MSPLHAHQNGFLQILGTSHLNLHSIVHLHGPAGILLDVQHWCHLPLCFGKEKIDQVVTIQLKHRANHPGLTFMRVSSEHSEQFLCCSRYQARHGISTIHGVRLASTSLAVGKHCDVEAIHRRSDQPPAICEDVFLRVVLIEDGVEVVVLRWRLFILGRAFQGKRIAPPDRNLLICFPLHFGADACEDTNGSFHVLHLVVVPFPQSLLLLEGFLNLFRALLPGLKHLLRLGGTFPDPLQLCHLSTELCRILFQLLNREVLLLQLAIDLNLPFLELKLQSAQLRRGFALLVAQLLVLCTQLAETLPRLLFFGNLPSRLLLQSLEFLLQAVQGGLLL
mmetsp:Transcript_12272/g.27182  ORF Transcript_12272/g.27182 Transcript_12272/m.27182 type:complete len:335 (+) Transcript_12272:565-1569(+)